MRNAVLATILLLAGVAACTDRAATGPDPSDADFGIWHGGPHQAIDVMTQNLYVGADVDAVIAALVSEDPTDDFPALLEAIETFQRTDFPARAELIADAIAAARPHVVGLQEVSEIDIDLTGLGVPIALQMDFLPILDAALAARGLTYAVAANVKNLDVMPVPGVRLVDLDVMLVDTSRVTVTGASGQLFFTNIGEVAPGVVLRRGWVQADAIIDGERYIFASAHLEPGSQPGLAELRAAQALEIVTQLGDSAPTVLLGDLNDVPGSPMYQVLQSAGFVDAWSTLRGTAPGYTCCHAADLSNKLPQFDEQIDYVFARDFEHRNGKLRGRITRSGMQPTRSLWPSDHAGVLATLLLR